MADDIFHGLSPNELKKEVARIIAVDARSLPPNAKIFSAIAQLQNFDRLPELTDHGCINKMIDQKCVELQRGLSGTKGVPAMLYAKELVLGPMYPGTLSALGNGIYLATTGEYADTPSNSQFFPKMSRMAFKYAANDDSGVILRCALKADAKILDFDDVRSIARDNRNRVRDAQVTDFGALTAALGFDAFVRDDTFDGSGEKVYVVVNRTALTFQREVLRRQK
ncbi:MAG: hypothetical protein LV479_06130 [Methylacidiphilales bacterium]|nr:hypothetical protein [Candidatus Methylacidiphilales bacterium]